jgi:hypothetical protein
MTTIWLGVALLAIAGVIIFIGVNTNMQAEGPVYIAGLFCAGFGTLFVIRGLIYHRD